MLILAQPDVDAVQQMTRSLFGGTVSTRVVQHEDEDPYVVFVATVSAGRNPKDVAAMHAEWHHRLESISPAAFGSFRLRVAFHDHAQ